MECKIKFNFLKKKQRECVHISLYVREEEKEKGKKEEKENLRKKEKWTREDWIKESAGSIYLYQL